jgi:pimeloyl-ACP methyl ester carboxylesterase
VPEQHGKPQGRTIQLGVVRTRTTGKTAAPDPLFVEQGGPGGTTIGVFADLALPNYPQLKSILQNRDLIFMEERGTKYSNPYLSCPEVNAHNIAVAKGEKEYTDPDWIKACHDRFKTKGIDPNAFNTRENAADVYYVAATLGYQHFNFYGVSYGTLLGQYVIAQSDKHKAKLRSVILDGVVRPDLDFNLASSHAISYALRNLFHACAQDRACSQAYPDLERNFLAIVDRLNQKPIPITLTIPSSQTKIASKLNGNTFVDGIMPYLLTTPHGGELPKQIKAASQGDFDWVTNKLSQALENDSAKEMYHSVLCARANSLQVTPDAVLPLPYPQLLPIGIRESQAVTKACDLLQIELKPPFVYENPEVPTLIFNGSFDPVTPQPYGEAVAKNLKTAYVFTFPGVGHGSLIVAPNLPAAACSTQIAVNFLANPHKLPNSSCLSQIKPVFWVK